MFAGNNGVYVWVSAYQAIIVEKEEHQFERNEREIQYKRESRDKNDSLYVQYFLVLLRTSQVYRHGKVREFVFEQHYFEILFSVIKAGEEWSIRIRPEAFPDEFVFRAGGA